jgi:uncharacterized membrane protein
MRQGEHRAGRREPLGLEHGRRRGLRSAGFQLLYLLAAFALALIVPQIPIGFTVSSARATEALVVTGAGVTTFIGVVYSLLFLVVQFGATTFTPRLNLFRDDPIVWHSFGFFAGILVFSFTAAFSIGGDDEEVTALVPIMQVVLLLAALALFRQLQSRAFRSIQLASILAQVADRGREVIDRLYPASRAAAPGPARVRGRDPRTVVTWPERMAVLQVIDVAPLVQRAQQTDAEIEFHARPGDTLAESDVLAIVHGGDGSAWDDIVLAAARVGQERTFEQDPLFALRVLADIALRALSPAINDPTTAVQALDAIESLLRPLAVRDLDVGMVRDPAGTVRVTAPMPEWEEFIGVALDEIVPSASSSIHLQRRLERMLEELMRRARAERRGALETRLAKL